MKQNLHTSNDPLRYFVWEILALTFVCFFLSQYHIIGVISNESFDDLTQSGGNQLEIDKLSIIIATDLFVGRPYETDLYIAFL